MAVAGATGRISNSGWDGVTLLYRSPNVVIDKHEWHVTVNLNGTKRTTNYRFRPAGLNAMWQHISKWSGRPPKEMWRFFAPYRPSVQVAMGEKKHARQARHEEIAARAA